MDGDESAHNLELADYRGESGAYNSWVLLEPAAAAKPDGAKRPRGRRKATADEEVAEEAGAGVEAEGGDEETDESGVVTKAKGVTLHLSRNSATGYRGVYRMKSLLVMKSLRQRR